VTRSIINRLGFPRTVISDFNVFPAVTLALAGALAVLCLFAVVVHEGTDESSAITAAAVTTGAPPAAADTQLMLVLDGPQLVAGKNAAAMDERKDAAPTGAALKAEENAAVIDAKVILHMLKIPSRSSLHPHPRPHTHSHPICLQGG